MTNNNLVLTDKLINQINITNQKAKEIKLFFNLTKNAVRVTPKQAQSFQDNFNYDFLNLKYANGKLHMTIADDYKPRSFKEFSAQPYATYDLNVINDLPNKKSLLLLYVFIVKNIKMGKHDATKSNTFKQSHLKAYTTIRNYQKIEDSIKAIDDITSKQGITLRCTRVTGAIKLTLSKVGECRTIEGTIKIEDIDIVQDDLSNVSDSKLEEIFLAVGLEIAKRNNNDSVSVVDNLKDIKTKDTDYTKENTIEHQDKEDIFNSLDNLVAQEQSNEHELTQIQDELSRVQDTINTRINIIKGHHYSITKAIQDKDLSKFNLTAKEKETLDYLNNLHRTSQKASLTLDMRYVAEALGVIPDNKGLEGLAYVLFDLVQYGLIDITISGYVLMSRMRVLAVEKKAQNLAKVYCINDKYNVPTPETQKIVVNNDMLPF